MLSGLGEVNTDTQFAFFQLAVMLVPMGCCHPHLPTFTYQINPSWKLHPQHAEVCLLSDSKILASYRQYIPLHTVIENPIFSQCHGEHLYPRIQKAEAGGLRV